MPTGLTRTLLALALCSCAASMTGCLKRTISITTQPPGALVWLNDVEVGRTPLETDFTFYGVYDVRLRREGYEPIITKKSARAPVYEWPGIDLAAEAVPAKIQTNLKWHWELTPVAENSMSKEQAEQELIARANELRGMTGGVKPTPDEPAPTTPPTDAPAAK